MAQDEYDNHAKKYFFTEEAFKLDRIRNYFTPIITYFNMLEELNNKKIQKEQRKGLKNILKETEKQCYKNISKIQEILKSKNTNNS